MHDTPLSLLDLAAIGDAEPTANVKKLLWEIHRLHRVIRRAQQVREMTRDAPSGVPQLVWDALCNELDAETWMKEGRTPRQEAKLRRKDEGN